MFRIEFLPARYGDALWIEYGAPGALHRVLIDGGTAGTRHDILKRVRALPADERKVELCVVTHVDRDHIEGVLGLLDADALAFGIDDFWFNGWPHLPDTGDETYGAVQGERLTAGILRHDLPWNAKFDGEAVVVPDEGDLPVMTLDGGLRLTLLSPTWKKLEELAPVWDAEVRAANLDPGFGLDPQDEAEEEEAFAAEDAPDVDALAETPFEEDDTQANGSSIAVLAEYGGKRALLAGDAHAGVLLESLERLSPGAPVELDLFKLPHHGSKHNVSRELLEKVRCGRWIFSTNGSIFHHPSPVAVARVARFGGAEPTLVFNYKNARNDVWEALAGVHGYRTIYPAAGKSGVAVEL